MTTRISKGRNGWEARTEIPMGVKNRILAISTYKTTGGVVTQTTVFTDMGDGGMSYDLFGGFSKRMVFKGLRCTERTVKELHQQALNVSNQLMSEAAAFYEKKDATKQAYMAQGAVALSAMSKKHMTCCICGEDAGHFEQHWNRDHGFGVCRECVDWVASRGDTAEEIENLYGLEGVNYAAHDDCEVYGRKVKVLAVFAEDDIGARRTDSYILLHPGAYVVRKFDRRIFVADVNDLGVPA